MARPARAGNEAYGNDLDTPASLIAFTVLRTATTMSAMNFLAENVKTLRKHYGMSQKDLADAIGVSYPRICEIEKGKANPTVTTLEKLAEVLNTTASDLLARQPKNNFSQAC